MNKPARDQSTPPTAKSKNRRGRGVPVDRIERWPITRLVPYANNPRLHSPEQVKQIAASMREFGQAQLIVVDEEGEIIAGHGRVLAAQEIGLKELRVAIAVGWSDEQKRAYRIADNQIGLTSRWDSLALHGELTELKAEGFDLELLGFEQGQLAALAFGIDMSGNSLEHEWQGMPEFGMDKQTPFKTLLVHFRNQADVDAFSKLIKQDVSNKFVWFPKADPPTKTADKRYVSAK